jgi:hypothetical protein
LYFEKGAYLAVLKHWRAGGQRQRQDKYKFLSNIPFKSSVVEPVIIYCGSGSGSDF